MARMNNVDMDRITTFTNEVKKDRNKARMTNVIEGEWRLQEGGEQFMANIKYENGQTTFKTDNPTFMGGGGNHPSPMHYCFFGLASCYCGSFTTAASSLGIRLNKVNVRLELNVNATRMLNLGDVPPIEEIRLTLLVKADAPESKIREAETIAQQRCPAVYTMRNPVNLTTRLEIQP